MNIRIDGARPQDDAERGILAFIEESIAIRHDLHRHPELSLGENARRRLLPGISCLSDMR